MNYVISAEADITFSNYIELLIGGPNQSHKVNFKELPDKGKRSNKKDRCAVVNIFFEDFEKTFKPSVELQGTPFIVRRFLPRRLLKGVRTMLVTA